MSKDWNETTLGDKISVKGGFGYKGKFIGEGDSLLLGMGCVSFTEPFLHKGARKYSGDCKDTYFVKPGDIVLATRQQSDNLPILGFPAIIPNDYQGKKVIVGTNLYQITNESDIDNKFLYWLFKSPQYRGHILGMSKGTTVRMITKDAVETFKFKCPSKPEREAISNFLWQIQEKIELNRQMNQTLEQMAQALFQSWFVDFDPVIDNIIMEAPDSYREKIPEALQVKAEKRKAILNSPPSEGGVPNGRGGHLPEDIQALFPNKFTFNDTLNKWIPEGWEVKSLDEEINLIGGGTPKTSIDEYWDGDIPWFSVTDAPNDSDVFVIDTVKKVTQLGVDKSSTKILREGTTIISARGTVGKCAIVGVPMAMNQSCYGVQSKKKCRDVFTYLILRKNVSDLQNKSHGSVFSTITRDTFKAIQVVLPVDDTLILKFEEQLTSSFEKIKRNLFQTETLTQLRDVLLPQLISGKLPVPEAMLEVEKVV